MIPDSENMSSIHAKMGGRLNPFNVTKTLIDWRSEIEASVLVFELDKILADKSDRAPCP